MPRLRALSGKEVVKIFVSFGFEVLSQRGSHIKLRRTVRAGRQTLTIPLHQELDRGTLRAIYRQAQKYIPENELFPHFCIQ